VYFENGKMLFNRVNCLLKNIIMKNSILLLGLCLNLTIQAQEKETKIQSVTSGFDRIEIIQMKPGTYMLEGLNTVVVEKPIKNGVILAGIGSVTDYHYYMVSDKNLPPVQEFPEASVPMDLLFRDIF
jgi:hypothetical protein